MSETNETIADIIAEKRNRANEIERDVAAKMANGEMFSDQYAREVIADLRREADRIEAAAKREEAEVEASALAAGGMVEASRHKQVGNAAAMRDALLAVKKSIDGIGASSLDCDPVILMSALTQICARICSRIDAALAAPAKNCDRHTGWLTAIKEFNDTEGRCKPWGDDIYDTRFLDWLFAPAAERKGDGDESK